MRIVDQGNLHIRRVSCGHCGTIYELDPTTEATASHTTRTEDVYHDANQRQVAYTQQYAVTTYTANCPVCGHNEIVAKTETPITHR